jgi:hypothetical protein
MGFSLKANIKKRQGFAGDATKRDEQFKYIGQQKQDFIGVGSPVISVDAKKKEMIGNFKRSGKVWCREAEEVNNYDFSSLAECIAVPYGIYDLASNQGYVYVGTSGNTSEFAADVISGSVIRFAPPPGILYGWTRRSLIQEYDA